MKIYHNIVEGLRSLFYWLPVIWKDRNWDYQFTLNVLEHSLRRLYKFLNGPDCAAWQPKSRIRQLRVCLLLLERMRGCYIDKAGKTEPRYVVGGMYADWNSDDCRYLEEQDWKYLWGLLEKYMRNWWD